MALYIYLEERRQIYRRINSVFKPVLTQKWGLIFIQGKFIAFKV